MTPETQHVEWKRSWRDEHLKWITQEAQVATRTTTQEARVTTQQPGKTTQEDGQATQETGGKTDSMPTRDCIVALLRTDPTLTRAALATRVGITPEGVKYHLDKLRKTGRNRHVRSTKKGRWEILESESTPP